MARLYEVFSAGVLARGRQYHEQGRVELGRLRAIPGPWRVRVRGRETYDVLVNLDLDAQGACTCPAFRRFGPCKHLVAGLLALAERGDLRLVDRRISPGPASAAILPLEDLPEEQPEVLPAPPPLGVLRLRNALTDPRGRLVPAELSFRYAHQEVSGLSRARTFEDGEGVVWRRHRAGERRLRARLRQHGVFLADGRARVRGSAGAFLDGHTLVPVVRQLLEEGFEVYAARALVRRAQTAGVRMTSGIDWFELDALARFGPEEVRLPELLLAVQRNQGFVRLSDGTFGLLPDNLPRELGRLLWFGRRHGDHLRLDRNQVWLLDALLPDAVSVDGEGRRVLERLRRRAAPGLRPQECPEPPGFGATLRPYQRQGLGWFRFLRRLGVGGCLADDMGLGKTVQVLALLESRRRRWPAPGPSLVVVPTSLLFHWQREADRFAPALRHLAFVGPDRFWQHAELVQQRFAGTDVVFTTYGTLRRDAAALGTVEWDYAVLDEATAIKNAQSQVARAARRVRARHRLALSGTPVENHLGELWSLFEFLNPGMPGQLPGFRRLLAGNTDPDHEAFVAALRRAVRPFLLRRTKAQVLPDLPPRTEQLLPCELPPAQRRSYDQLARHYQQALRGGLDQETLPEALRFQVLVALLRLRQAACHPGLVDPERAGEDCAKFQALEPMLAQLREEGHKVLVFSQFPSFLRLLRPRLEAAGHATAWIDGATRRRQEEVDRFQKDPDCGVFLLSLRAAGHGLNLTAASYVFLLDPWWNPAIEAQAIDRTHRLGQDKPVHAYRLICRHTVEERVAELQARKRQLADVVLGDEALGEEGSVLAGLSGEDLGFLLG